MLANRTNHRFVGLLGIALLTLSLLASPTAHADMFEVKDVDVDATASSAAEARDQALGTGQREAFYRLLHRLTPTRYHGQLPNLDPGTVATYVRDFSVANEQTSSVRYLARLNVRFKETDIRFLLEEFGIPFTETQSRPVVVLPVLSRAGTAILWRDPNPWRVAWGRVAMPVLPVPLLLPVGDLQDVNSISAQQTLGTDPAPLEQIAARYGAGGAIIVNANIAAIGAPHVDLTMTRRDIGSPAETFSARVNAASGETIDQVLVRAVATAIETIEENWKDQTVMRFDTGGILAINVPLTALDHWVRIRRDLGTVAVVERTDIILLSRTEALLNVHYIGEVSQLARALAQANLTLQEEQGVWTLLTPETLSRAGAVQ